MKINKDVYHNKKKKANSFGSMHRVFGKEDILFALFSVLQGFSRGPGGLETAAEGKHEFAVPVILIGMKWKSCDGLVSGEIPSEIVHLTIEDGGRWEIDVNKVRCEIKSMISQS
jgi:hypothetical protein